MTGSSAPHPAKTLSGVSIRLCGRMAVEIGGRERPVARDELIDLLWPRDAPASPDDVLTALLSKIRAALGPGTLESRRELTLADAWIDVEAAAAQHGRAEDAFERSDWAEVCRAGHDVLDLAARSCGCARSSGSAGRRSSWAGRASAPPSARGARSSSRRRSARAATCC